MTDFRALCAELLAWADKTSAHYYMQPEVLVRARAALAEEPPEPAPPADGEVAKLAAWLRQEFVRNQQIGNRTSALQALRAAELLERLQELENNG